MTTMRTCLNLLGRRTFTLVAAISALSLAGYIVTIRTQQIKTSRAGFMVQRTAEKESKTANRSVFEALIADGFRPIALTPTCQYETARSKLVVRRRTTRIPAPWDTAGTRRLTPGVTVASSPMTRGPMPAGAGEAAHAPAAVVCSEERQSPVKSSGSTVRVIPNVVHYVFIGTDFEFRFITHLSLLSAHRFLRPDQILIHGDALPTGRWWDETARQLFNVYHVKRNYSERAPNGQPFKFKAHVSDYIRAEILARYGGIYLDPDVLVLRSFDDLRHHSFVLGRESDDSVGNGIILSRPGAPFLHLILEQYWSYTGPDEEWATQSVHNVHKLALIYRHLIHVEERSMNRPNWLEKAQIYDGNYDWTNGSYAIHLWLRLWPKEKVPSDWEDLTNVNTTIGQIAQHIRQPS